MDIVQIIKALGILNLTMAILLFISCRCIPATKMFSHIMEHSWYKSYYKYHCYLWYVFWTSVVIHASLAIAFLRVPSTG